MKVNLWSFILASIGDLARLFIRGEVVFKVVGSPFAEAYGPSTQSVCYTVLGFLQGAAMTLFDKETDGLEVQCMAKGDTCCRFVVSGRPG